MGCPVCEGRTGPKTSLESMCQPHFDAAPVPSKEEILDAMERGRQAAMAARQANRGYRPRRCRCGCHCC